MASKKEHKRKQKSRGSSDGEENGGGNAPYPPGSELNSLDLLSTLYGVPKAPEARREGEPPAPTHDDGADRERDDNDSGSMSDEEERRREEEEAAEKARLAAEAAERSRLAEEARRRAEEEDRRREEAEATEKARLAAEAEERSRLAEEARRRAEEEERRREEAEAAEKTRLAAEAEERSRLAEEARRRAEEERRRAEKEERRRREEEAEAFRIALEQREAERARRQAEEAERARRLAEQVLRAREAEEEKRRAAREREAFSGGAGPARTSPSAAAVPPAPPLEIDNPFWQRPPEIFDVLSGAPHRALPPETPGYVRAADSEPALPVTMADDGVDQAAGPRPDSMSDSPGSDGEENARGAPRTVPVPMEKRMYVVMVTPEVAPCAKVGGLGDVVLGLGRELMRRGHGVEVVCPMYSGMRYDLIEDLHEEYAELWCPHFNEWRREKVFQGRVGGGLQVNFITGGAYTERPSIYGYDDDMDRFAYFSRQALEFLFKTGRRPDIIHCHDWATGLVPPILWDIYEKMGWNNSRVVYTIHNNECQGLCGYGGKLLEMVGLDIRRHMRADRMQDDVNRNCINMMKAGIVFSNFVTTVSPTYAGELKNAVGGRGLQTTIAKNSAKIGGVLNGIDYDAWNPAADPKLAARYSSGDDFYQKYRNKTALREWLGLWDSWKPIVSVVTRLTRQKGLELIKHAIRSVQDMQGQFVLLGSAPDPKVNDEFLHLQDELRDNHDVNLYIGYHEDLSRLIYAGSDIFFVPSLYEPCGLTQMISLRYGTVPVVRETGGLVDTVFDLHNSGRGLNDANGFTFRDPAPESADYGLTRAIRLWYDNPEGFNRLARNGMRYDYSWRHPAEHYENIYNYIKA